MSAKKLLKQKQQQKHNDAFHLFTTPNLKNPTLQQTIIQSTVKPSVAQKYSQMDYQKFRTVTKPSYKKQTSHRHKFAEHDYNYVNGPKTTKPKTNTQNFFSQNQNIPQPTLNLVNFYDQPRSSQEQSENYPFFQQNKNTTNKRHTENQPHYYAQNYFRSDDEKYYNQNHQRFYSSQRPRSYRIDQPDIFNTYTQNEQSDNLELIQHLTTKIFNSKIPLTHNHTNQLKCITKFHCHVIYNNTK